MLLQLLRDRRIGSGEAPPPSPGNSVRSGALPRQLYWIASAAILIPVWIAGRFPTEDGPAHVYYTEVYRDLANPDSKFRLFYERSIHWNTPNLAYFWLQYVLSGAVEPHLAQRIAVSLILVATVAATFVLSVTVSGEVGVGALAALLLLHNSFLYAGYFSFLAGLPFLLLGLALLVGPLDNRNLPAPALVRSLFLVLLLGLLSFYSHLVAAGLFLLLIGLRVAIWPGAPVSRRALVALAAAPLVILIVTYMLGPSTGSGGIRWLAPSDAIHAFVRLRFWEGFAVPNTDYRIRRWILTLITGLLVWWSGRSLIAGKAPRSCQFALLAGGMFLFLRFTLPNSLGQGGMLAERIDLATWVLVLPLLIAPDSRSVRVSLIAVLLLLLGWQLTDTSLRVRRFDRAYRAVEAQVAEIPAGSIIRPGPPQGGTSFEGSSARVLAELAQEVAYQCDCIVVGGHHPKTPYFWVRQRAGVEARAELLVRVDSTGASGADQPGLSLRITRVARQRPDVPAIRESEPPRASSAPAK